MQIPEVEQDIKMERFLYHPTVFTVFPQGCKETLLISEAESFLFTDIPKQVFAVELIDN